MIVWLEWFLSPIGRWFSLAGVAIAAIFGAYVKGRVEASERLRRKQAEDSNRRLRDAIEADSRARERIARGELRNDDGHRRD